MDSSDVQKTISIRIKRLIVLATYGIILLVPTYSETEAHKAGLIMNEITFYWPWMILTHYTPNHPYSSDQYSVVAFPWSFFLFIPFIYSLSSSWRIYVSDHDLPKNMIAVLISSIIQGMILYFTILSQDFSKETGVDSETVKIYFVPQILLIVIYSAFLANMIRKHNKIGNE